MSYTSTPPPGAGGPPVDVATRYVLAGWWSRAGAQVMDGALVAVGAAVLVVLFTAPFGIGFFADDADFWSVVVGLLVTLVCVALVALLYAPALMARTDGRTLGRMVTGIRVVRANGRPIDFGFAMLREVVVKTLLFGLIGLLTGGLGWLLDYLWPLWDEENRALHDYVVNTRTVVD